MVVAAAAAAPTAATTAAAGMLRVPAQMREDRNGSLHKIQASRVVHIPRHAHLLETPHLLGAHPAHLCVTLREREVGIRFAPPLKFQPHPKPHALFRVTLRYIAVTLALPVFLQQRKRALLLALLALVAPLLNDGSYRVTTTLTSRLLRNKAIEGVVLSSTCAALTS